MAQTIDDTDSQQQYSYIHISGSDGKLDHWVPTEDLKIPRTKRSKVDSIPEKHMKVRKVDNIVFDGKIIPCWYFSPFPAELDEQLRQNGGRLYVCEVCLKYTPSKTAFRRHKETGVGCGGGSVLRGIHCPPGSQIYSDSTWSVWEVDGGPAIGTHEESSSWEGVSVMAHTFPFNSIQFLEESYRLRYCQSVSLISRLFLNTKLNRYGSNAFKFYILTEETSDPPKYRYRGMFSREKRHASNNLSCIAILPPWQQGGWGKRLIHVSYLLSRVERVPGTPEKPLSELGKRVYDSYFRHQVITFLQHADFNPHPRYRIPYFFVLMNTIAATGIESDNVKETFKLLDIVRTSKAKKKIKEKFIDLSSLPESHYDSSNLVDVSLLYHISVSESVGQPAIDE
eukprot:TRINITY_DN6937_c0_g1_i4.p1 TRINITY_DN6937_c0_g1~~TRINITY_DN6937_c0_g1_i4.p1  ORF type:complete len:396 (+),score=49.46 TRINITY_DN6937_c0_g1_i4:110-1297(+)